MRTGPTQHNFVGAQKPIRRRLERSGIRPLRYERAAVPSSRIETGPSSAGRFSSYVDSPVFISARRVTLLVSGKHRVPDLLLLGPVGRPKHGAKLALGDAEGAVEDSLLEPRGEAGEGYDLGETRSGDAEPPGHRGEVGDRSTTDQAFDLMRERELTSDAFGRRRRGGPFFSRRTGRPLLRRCGGRRGPSMNGSGFWRWRLIRTRRASPGSRDRDPELEREGLTHGISFTACPNSAASSLIPVARNRTSTSPVRPSNTTRSISSRTIRSRSRGNIADHRSSNWWSAPRTSFSVMTRPSSPVSSSRNPRSRASSCPSASSPSVCGVVRHEKCARLEDESSSRGVDGSPR